MFLILWIVSWNYGFFPLPYSWWRGHCLHGMPWSLRALNLGADCLPPVGQPFFWISRQIRLRFLGASCGRRAATVSNVIFSVTTQKNTVFVFACPPLTWFQKTLCSEEARELCLPLVFLIFKKTESQILQCHVKIQRFSIPLLTVRRTFLWDKANCVCIYPTRKRKWSTMAFAMPSGPKFSS